MKIYPIRDPLLLPLRKTMVSFLLRDTLQHNSLMIPWDTHISLIVLSDPHINLVVPSDPHISLVLPKDTHIHLVLSKDMQRGVIP